MKEGAARRTSRATRVHATGHCGVQAAPVVRRHLHLWMVHEWQMAESRRHWCLEGLPEGLPEFWVALERRGTHLAAQRVVAQNSLTRGGRLEPTARDPSSNG